MDKTEGVLHQQESTQKFWTLCLLLSHLSVRKCILWFDFWLSLRDKPKNSRKGYFLLIAETFFKLK